MSNYSTGRRSNSARIAWIVTAIIAALAVAAVIIVLFIADAPAPSPSPTQATPTVQPTPSPTGSPTTTPTVTPTPSPTSTGTPSPTASPKPTPSPSGSSSPSPTPTVDPAVAWANSLYGTFSPVSAAGTGDSHVAVPKGVKGALLTVTNNGADDQDFTVEVMNQFGKSMGTLVDAQGDYQGTLAYGLTSQLGSTPTTILISSAGNWSIEFAPISSAADEFGDGLSDDVLLYGGAASPLSVQSLTSGDFSLTTYAGNNPRPNQIASETGWWTGTVNLPAGPLVLVVTSDGSWNLQLGVLQQ